MRYFQRAGSGCVLQETPDRTRFIKGPDADGPGDIVSYNEAYPDEKVWAEQLASDYNWVEVDRNGDLPAPPPPLKHDPVIDACNEHPDGCPDGSHDTETSE
jgi:hypothetical protein